MSILEHINSPQDVKALPAEQLPELAEQIREYIKATVLQNGGHLSSNLGTVELTLALHRVFDTPRDKIVWDVGHQAYTHKIITGRREAFSTLRTSGGLSGFPKCSENEHDAFTVGHSSTSISAALGLARARDLLGRQDDIIAVIGDGALTGGLALEALNDVGRSNTRLIIVLNDNEMSIQRNVGALSDYLFQIRARKSYQNAKKRLKLLLKRDSILRKLAESTKDRIKYMLLHGTWFEEIGIKYVGPFDGHNIEHLIHALETAKKFDSPVLVHVRTRKGKGDQNAEAQPEKYHGVNPAGHASTGFPYSTIAGIALTEMAGKDPRIVAVAAAMAKSCGLEPFYQAYPQRFFDVGIAEEHAVTMSAGMAQGGFRPVVAVYSTFLQRAYDEILHDVCIAKLPVVLMVCSSGLTGEDGETHQGVFGLSYLSHIPGMRIYAPSNASEVYALIKTAIASDGPCAILLPKGSVPPCREEHTERECTGWYTGSRGGAVALLAYSGRILEECYKAQNLLAEQGIKADVWHCPQVQPLDEQAWGEIKTSYTHIVSVEDNVLKGGFGAALLQSLPREQRDRLLTLGVGDHFIPHASICEQLRREGLDALGITQSVLEEIKQ
ncbi:MAG: 1-deoxy-D-xylulose-5-phosphate synthase [Eubacteriales bacterium]|nr:1-deoxy-D-xylulose-5-phosphate synthase [Eubacteriales bacterium]